MFGQVESWLNGNLRRNEAKGNFRTLRSGHSPSANVNVCFEDYDVKNLFSNESKTWTKVNFENKFWSEGKLVLF
ncbi:MAG: hypothetical protein ACTS80_01350 [Candidatus Hodgkinia cicadicola]